MSFFELLPGIAGIAAGVGAQGFVWLKKRERAEALRDEALAARDRAVATQKAAAEGLAAFGNQVIIPRDSQTGRFGLSDKVELVVWRRGKEFTKGRVDPE